MTTRNKNRFALALLLFLPLHLCLAQAPSGIVSFDFDNTTSPVWDLSGTLIFQQTMIGAASQESPLAFGVEVTQDARGQLTGSGATLVTVGNNDSVAAQYTVRGKVSGGGGRTVRASIDVFLIGEDIVAGINTPFKIKVHYNLEASTEDLAFVGRASGNAVFRELSSARIRSEVSVAAPGSLDGSWTAQMNIIPLRKLGGSGSIILSSGRVLPTHLSGSYSGSSAIANVKLVGVDEGAGVSANVKFISSEDGIELQSIKGKILGQTVRQ
jgi:hypothetical protein